MKRLGFEEGPRTKSHLFTLRRQTARTKAYVSIRFDYVNNVSTVMAEFWGRSKTRLPGIGAEVHLIEITPRQKNMKKFPGAGGSAVTAHFAEIGKMVVHAAKVMDALEAF